MSRRTMVEVAIWIFTLCCVALMFAAPLRQLIVYVRQARSGLP